MFTFPIFWSGVRARGTLQKLSVEVLVVYGFYLFAVHFLPLVNDLLVLYIVLELQGLAAYILTASFKTNILSLEAGAKYFYLKFACVRSVFTWRIGSIRFASVR
jgi:NADH:ubiquinone oxidoreductase subunit 2 (subunit N)